jgi:hypothetical protein
MGKQELHRAHTAEEARASPVAARDRGIWRAARCDSLAASSGQLQWEVMGAAQPVGICPGLEEEPQEGALLVVGLHATHGQREQGSPSCVADGRAGT